jgi:hypothetical protein
MLRPAILTINRQPWENVGLALAQSIKVPDSQTLLVDGHAVFPYGTTSTAAAQLVKDAESWTANQNFGEFNTSVKTLILLPGAQPKAFKERQNNNNNNPWWFSVKYAGRQQTTTNVLMTFKFEPTLSYVLVTDNEQLKQRIRDRILQVKHPAGQFSIMHGFLFGARLLLHKASYCR